MVLDIYISLRNFCCVCAHMIYRDLLKLLNVIQHAAWYLINIHPWQGGNLEFNFFEREGRRKKKVLGPAFRSLGFLKR